MEGELGRVGSAPAQVAYVVSDMFRERRVQLPRATRDRRPPTMARADHTDLDAQQLSISSPFHSRSLPCDQADDLDVSAIWWPSRPC
ncbi:hypothetical protein SAMN05216268_11183 [Streptomyces yunnanensis]|uniref:Uncharacterized protein n=1 Tax=Streptomyces yunnanensis TaxID=156453 RepID=A0A9X8MZR0_9ACTN|nr:hypothetical protein SAMN05216268_11183 [Streptomyces yunnanensis]